MLFSTAPETHTITEGEISPETITAPRDFVDEAATQKLQEEERAKIGPVYNQDSSVTQESLDALAADFAAFESARDWAQQYYVNAQISALQAAENQRVQTEIQNIQNDTKTSAVPAPTAAVITAEDVVFIPENLDWQAILPEQEQTRILGMLPAYLNDSDWIAVISLTKQRLAELYDAVYNSASQELTTGFKVENTSEVISRIVLNITESASLTAQESRLVTECLQQDLQANIVFDQTATRLQQDEAANSVSPVMYRKGQNIVMKGEIVTPAQYSILDQMGLLDQPDSERDYTLSTLLFIALLFTVYIIYTINFDKRLAANTKSVAILAILTVLALAVTAIMARIAPEILITYMVVILAAVLVSAKSAVSYGVFIALLIVTVLTTKHAFFTDAGFIRVITSITGGIFAVVILRKVSFRAALILAGLTASIPGIVLQVILWKENIVASTALLSNMAWLVVGGVMSGVVAVGLLPAMESIFKITTPTKLLELSDPNHPLLKRLLLEAPGTYHHSLYVGNLAEAGCEAVGANALLARVGSYYHDVGKLKNPMYFVENQRNANPHDRLLPEQSAQIIMDHVSDGYELLTKYKMPSEIKKIMQQHHGDTPIAFFYHKARETENKVDINDYRYPCPKPDTRESAIVMLADTVEAAMRTLDDPSEAETFEFIKKLIQSKYDDGQLDLTPLTRRDMTMIARAFASIYSGMQHNRIKYPRLNLNEDKDENSHM